MPPEDHNVEAGLTLTPQNIEQLRRILGKTPSVKMLRQGQVPSVEQVILDMLRTKYPKIDSLTKAVEIKRPSRLDRAREARTGERIDGYANVDFFRNENDPEQIPRSITALKWKGLNSPRDMREFADTIGHEQTHLVQTRNLPRLQKFQGSYKTGNPQTMLDEETGRPVQVGSTPEEYRNQKWERDARRGGWVASTAIDRMKELLGGPLTEQTAIASDIPLWQLSSFERRPISQALKYAEEEGHRSARKARKAVVLGNRYNRPVDQNVNLGTIQQILSDTHPNIIPKLVQDRFPKASMYRGTPEGMPRLLPNRDQILGDKEKERLWNILTHPTTVREEEE